MYMVFDKECNVKTIYKRKASPWHPDNWCVANGWKIQGDKECSYEYFKSREDSTFTKIPENVTVLVGFNIKFDLLWEMVQGNTELTSFYKRGGTIWDCQYAEYLLNGQQQKYQMAALTDTAPRYGGTTKIDEVKALWDEGVNTCDIPEDLLIDYLVGTHEEKRNGGDVRNTELCFLGQVARAVEQGQIKMIQDRMFGLLCTTEMEYNGIKVDVAEAKRRLSVLWGELSTATTDLNNFLPVFPKELEFKWSSGTQVSCLIFGGAIRYKKKANYRDEEGEWVRYKDKAPFPLFNKRPVDPTRFGWAWDREVKEWLAPDTGSAITVDGMSLTASTKDDSILFQISKGNRVIPQDLFLSGKKKGIVKTKIMPLDGPLKERYTEYGFKCDGFTEPDTQWKTKKTDFNDEPIYSVAGEVIDELEFRGIPFTDALSNRARLDKEIGTYYFRMDPKKGPVGMLTCVDTETHIIHHNINHTSTITTRLSSSNPNLQNTTRGDMRKDGTYKSEVKKMFISRFGADGVMLEPDYSQLEVVVQGVLSGDIQLCKDLRNKIDFHCKRVSSSKGCTYDEALLWCKDENHEKYPEWSVFRTGAKGFSFQRAFGAGAKAIANSTGMSIEDVEALIASEERTYPGITAFNNKVADACAASAVPFQNLDEETGNWKTYLRGEWYGPTNTKYTWRSYNAPEWMKGETTTFSPPEQKNYPVQGTGGEFVQAMLGLLWKHFIANDNYGGKAFLINTVHDCVWMDCHKDVILQVAKDVKPIMESIPEYYNNRYGMNITVPFPVDCEAGINMLELGHLKEKY